MPQPVDLNTELGRINTAERFQQMADKASLAAQQRASVHAAEAQVQQETQIQETPQSQSEQIGAEGKRRNPFVGRRKRRALGEPDKEGSPDDDPKIIVDPDEGNQLDISI